MDTLLVLPPVMFLDISVHRSAVHPCTGKVIKTVKVPAENLDDSNGRDGDWKTALAPVRSLPLKKWT